MDDPLAASARADVERLVLCSGKVYVDLVSSELRQARPTVAIVRIEQLYPFPAARRRRDPRELSEGAGSDLGAGRAGEHGRVGVRAAGARRADRWPAAAALHRPAAERGSVGRVGVPARCQSEGASSSRHLPCERTRRRRKRDALARPLQKEFDPRGHQHRRPRSSANRSSKRVSRRWLKKPGDAVAAGEPLVELETEKINLEVGAEQAGVLAEIKRQEGEDVKVGELLGDHRRQGGTGVRQPRQPRASPAPAESTAAPTASAEAAPARRRSASAGRRPRRARSPRRTPSIWPGVARQWRGRTRHQERRRDVSFD